MITFGVRGHSPSTSRESSPKPAKKTNLKPPNDIWTKTRKSDEDNRIKRWDEDYPSVYSRQVEHTKRQVLLNPEKIEQFGLLRDDVDKRLKALAPFYPDSQAFENARRAALKKFNRKKCQEKLGVPSTAEQSYHKTLREIEKLDNKKDYAEILERLALYSQYFTLYVENLKKNSPDDVEGFAIVKTNKALRKNYNDKNDDGFVVDFDKLDMSLKDDFLKNEAKVIEEFRALKARLSKNVSGEKPERRQLKTDALEALSNLEIPSDPTTTLSALHNTFTSFMLELKQKFAKLSSESINTQFKSIQKGINELEIEKDDGFSPVQKLRLLMEDIKQAAKPSSAKKETRISPIADKYTYEQRNSGDDQSSESEAGQKPLRTSKHRYELLKDPVQ
jgi:hypothetical protein